MKIVFYLLIILASVVMIIDSARILGPVILMESDDGGETPPSLTPTPPPSPKVLPNRPTISKVVPKSKPTAKPTPKTIIPTSRPKNSPTPTRRSDPSAPVAQVSYHEVPDNVKNLTVDCQAKGFIPSEIQSESYECTNIYQSDSDSFSRKAAQSGAQRMLLFGEYIYFDCPRESSDRMKQCYEAAKFMDNWQIPKMLQLLSFPRPSKKVYYRFNSNSSQTRDICAKLGLGPASACFKNGQEIFRTVLSGSSGVYHSSGLTSEWRITEGANNEVKYDYAQAMPKGCFTADVHETVHYIAHQYLGYGITSNINEAITRLLETKLLDEFCRPGIQYFRAVKVENGVVSKVPDFNINKLDLEEPLTNDLEFYSQGRQCLKGLYMQFARSIRNSGLGFVKGFYNEVNKQSNQKDSTYARSLWIATGQSSEIKTFLESNGCRW